MAPPPSTVSSVATRTRVMHLLQSSARLPVVRAALRAAHLRPLAPAVAGRCFSCQRRILQQPKHSRAQQPAFARLPTRRPTRRSYHSTDHPAPAGPFTPAERDIHSAAYKHVPSHGFTTEALALGARDAGYLDISTAVLPDGVFGLIRWHLETQKAALAGRASELLKEEGEGGKRMGVGQKVEALVWERLMGNAPIAGRWQEALAILAQPSYVPASLKALAELADEIWYLVGDVSVDPSWYTKRASLSAIYASTELFMTNDHSVDFQDTRAFLRRRLGEINELGSAARSVGLWVGFTASSAVNVLRSKGVPI